jgi:uncharacterized protein DUF397
MDQAPARWFTSSFSGSNGASCVEVAIAGRTVAVRDTKDRTRPPLTCSATAWDAFLGATRAGRFG